MKNHEIINYLNNEFMPETFSFDYALNGLILKNSGKISKIGTAVDTGVETFYEAKKHGVDFLMTHHGLLLKDRSVPITDTMYEKVKVLIENDIAYYSIHIPLDTNKTFSNNQAILDKMRWDSFGSFGDYNGIDIGLYTDFSEAMNIEDIIEKIEEKITKKIKIWAFGDYMVKRVGIISGNGINHLEEAYNSNIDLLITGEPSHKMYWKAYEMGIKCIFCGHYATETFGIRKVGDYLAENFNLEHIFIDLPTGT